MAVNSRVLVVDDDADLRKTLSDVLELKGYEPVGAATGRAALTRVKEVVVAVAVIDLRLEDMSGLDVLREIKRSSLDTECIVLTGYASQESAIAAVNLGAYSYVQKPYDMELLLLTIRRAVEKRKAEEERRESEQFNASLLNSAPHPMLVLTPDSSVRDVNPALEELTGFSYVELLGVKAPYPWWIEETLEKTRQDLEIAMRRGTRRLEELFQKKSRERFRVEIGVTPVLRDGEPQYYLENWLDITGRTKTEDVRLRRE